MSAILTQNDFPVGVSTATAAALGLSRHRVRARTTTAYLLVGEACRGGCAFCSMTSVGPAEGKTCGGPRLSRVSWPVRRASEVIAALAAGAGSLDRVCLQVVKGMEALAADLIAGIRAAAGLPVSVSCGPKNLRAAEMVMDGGADCIGISLDAVTPEIFAKMKGGDFHERLDLILAAGAKWPGRVTTHLIVGLGETEEQMCRVAVRLYGAGVKVALFAFTPIPGTPMAGCLPPDLGSYRRIQFFLGLSRESLAAGLPEFDGSGKIIALRVAASDRDLVLGAIGRAIMTSGCRGCNRPFYNERAAQTPYNYPWPPIDADIGEAITASGLSGSLLSVPASSAILSEIRP